MEVIRSASHPLARRVRAVLRGREPGTCLLEGDLLVDEAQRSGLALEELLVSDRRPDRLRELDGAGLRPRAVEAGLLERLSGLVTSPGILALAREPESPTAGRLALDARSLVVVVAGVQDPGNLGALARTAEAAGAVALCVVEGGCSPFNAKALRGSMGSLLRLPVLRPPDAAAALAELRELGLRQAVAATRGGEAFDSFPWRGPLALWLTGETGRLDFPVGEAPEPVTIPLAAGVESLNVGAAAAVLAFAARRGLDREPAS